MVENRVVNDHNNGSHSSSDAHICMCTKFKTVCPNKLTFYTFLLPNVFIHKLMILIWISYSLMARDVTEIHHIEK